MKFKKLTFPVLALLIVSAGCSAYAAQTIGVNFQGRKSDNTGSGDPLAPTESAGVVAQANWNNVDDSTFTPAEKGTTAALLDSAGAATPVTLTFNANDSWNNDTDPATITTANARMMNGIIKEQGAGTSSTFLFNNVPEGQYDLYVYLSMNGDGVRTDVTDRDGLTTFYVIEPHQFTDTNTFTQATSTDAAAPQLGSYVKFTNLGTYGRGSIGFSAKYISGADGNGISGLQLVNTGPAIANTNRVSIATQPSSRTNVVGDNVTLSIVTAGPAFSIQWFKGTTAIPNATNLSYTLPPLTAADNGAMFHTVVSNNVNSVTSENAVITVVVPVFAGGLLKREYFPGATRASLENGTAGAPSSITALPSFEAPSGVADNYAQRISGFFIPATSGQYVFFLNSDNDSDLFLSTDDNPANKKLIAHETGWSNVRQWNATGSGGGTTAEEKRSDMFTGSEWIPVNQISLTASNRYYIEAAMAEGGGGDNLAVYIKKAEDDDPADAAAPSAAGGSWGFLALPATVSFTQQPQSTNISAGKTTTLRVVATTTSPFGITGYQWKSNGVAVAGATSASYTTPRLAVAATGAQYTVDVIAAGAGAVPSNPATITVVPDTTPPQALSAGSLKTFGGDTEVGIIFDEALTPASVTALSNYTLDKGATVTAARYVTNSSGLNTIESGVVLTATGLTAGTAYTLTVKGVSDLGGNAITTPQTVNFTASPLNSLSLGATVNDVKNEAFIVGTNGFNLVNGGLAFWGTTDDITMVYEPITGDFDKQVQVEWNDPSSNWARAGISARESLNNGQPTTATDGGNPASRYQIVLADPMTKFDGTTANDAFESNRRLDTGGATSARTGSAVGAVKFPDAWVRLKRVGQRISMFWGTNGVTWTTLGTTDFGDDTVSAEGPMAAQLFVGPTLGVENGNITGQGGTAEQQGAFAARFRNYGNAPQVARGTETYSIGLNFGANEEGAQLSPSDVAGVAGVAQGNWNNIFGNEVTAQGGIVAEKAGASNTTTVTVDVTGSGNTWASQGPRGEQNNQVPGENGVLLTGYLDTGAATTTQVKISNIPTDLTSAGYDVVVYTLGGVGNKGGGYRVTDAAGAVLADYVKAGAPVNPTGLTEAVSAATNTFGTYIVFKNLKAPNIIVEATTAGGLGFSNAAGDPRAPINAIQLVTPSGLTGGGGGQTPTISVAKGGATGVTITFEGTLQQSPTVNGTYADVPGATSPYPAPTTDAAKFFRAKR